MLLLRFLFPAQSQDTIASYVQAVFQEAENMLRLALRSAGEISDSSPFRGYQGPKICFPTASAICIRPSAEGRQPPSRRGSLRGISNYSKILSQSIFQTLYLGGGTPSLLGPKNLTTLINGLNNLFKLGSGFEPTAEACENVAHECATVPEGLPLYKEIERDSIRK